jgi:hypothetical protein
VPNDALGRKILSEFRLGEKMKLVKSGIGVILAALAAYATAGPGDGDLLKLLRLPAHRTSLGVSAEKLLQIDKVLSMMDTKISDITSKARPEIKVGGFSIGKAPDMFGAVEKIQNEFRGQVVKLLMPEQLRMATQLGAKLEGNFAYLMPEVLAQIPIDKKLLGQIQNFKREYVEYDRTLLGQIKAGKLVEAERLKLLAEKDAILQEKIGGLVPADIAAKLRDLTSPKI